MAPVEVFALADMVGEEAELAGRAPTLAIEAALGEAGFGHASLGDGFAAGLYAVCNLVEKIGPRFARGPAIGSVGLVGGLCGAIDFGCAAAGDVKALSVEACGFERLRRCVPFACDEMLSGELVGHVYPFGFVGSVIVAR